MKITLFESLSHNLHQSIQLRQFTQSLNSIIQSIYMQNTGKFLSTHHQNLFSQLQALVQQYPIHFPQLEALLLQLSDSPASEPSDPALLATQTETLFNTLLMTLLNFTVDRSQPDWQRKCGLPQQRLVALKELLQMVCGGAASHLLKRSVVISLIQNVLECLGVSDLTEVLDVISSQIPRFASALQESDQLKLLRVINLLLKRISKTEDYYLRGQLHLALARFLPLCHDSGFHFRAPPSRSSECQKLTSDTPLPEPPGPGLTYQFYQQFWQLQQWFSEPNQVTGEGASSRLKKIHQTLFQVLNYFQTHPAKSTSDYYSQPLKFLKNYNLLALQLADPFFRKVIMLQTLFFTYSLSHPLSKSPQPSDSDKKILVEIEAIPKRYLGDSLEQDRQLLLETQRILGGQQRWTELKEQWKDKKKFFSRRAEDFKEEELKKKEQVKKAQKQIDKRRIQIRRQITQKMKIQGNKLEQFLSNKEPISLEAGPTYTSFSYFFNQAMNCLNTFDTDSGKQTEFQTRAEYNMFEWKAMRSLYRENIKDIWSNNDKASSKMKDHKIVSLMNRKQQQFTDPQPSKKVKEL